MFAQMSLLIQCEQMNFFPQNLSIFNKIDIMMSMSIIAVYLIFIKGVGTQISKLV